MAEITKNTPGITASLASLLIPANNKITGLYCGENLAVLDACYIKSDGTIRRSTGAGAGAAAPAAPAVATATTGGTVAAGTYGVAVSYVTATGETVVSPTTYITTTGSTSTITVTSPPAATGATNYKVYMTAPNGAVLTLQNGAGTAIGTNFTLTAPPNTGTASPLASGALFPASRVDGYAMTQGNVAQNDAVTLAFGIVVNYGTGLTPGARYYLSGATIGGLADAPSNAGIAPIGSAIDQSRVYLHRSTY